MSVENECTLMGLHQGSQIHVRRLINYKILILLINNFNMFIKDISTLPAPFTSTKLSRTTSIPSLTTSTESTKSANITQIQILRNLFN